jgi:hypothetical protein
MRFAIYIVLDEHVLDLLSNLRFKFTPNDLISIFLFKSSSIHL